ncbi:MAG: type II toxin-antitoxin system death-on-curing family toxin [Candidatus Kapabacteria bacterium]|nr:type II toxin-antitoxin system death-on-curing family toxin [Candidatus Kapabacteria bacterium]
MRYDSQNEIHLTLDIVVEIHRRSIENYSGTLGVRDSALLESAIAAPQATFGGVSPYHDLVEIAGAYLYFLCRNQPFIDGNKRTALAACIVFLRLNGTELRRDSSEWERLVMDITSSVIDRTEATTRLRALILGSISP